MQGHTRPGPEPTVESFSKMVMADFLCRLILVHVIINEDLSFIMLATISFFIGGGSVYVEEMIRKGARNKD